MCWADYATFRVAAGLNRFAELLRSAALIAWRSTRSSGIMPTKTHSLGEPAKRPSQDGVIHCAERVRGKAVKSIYVSGVDNFNVVNVDFMDGTT